MQTQSGGALRRFQKSGTKGIETVCIDWWNHSAAAVGSFVGLSPYSANRREILFQIGRMLRAVQ